jgi:hypothetical protein
MGGDSLVVSIYLNFSLALCIQYPYNEGGFDATIGSLGKGPSMFS